MFELPFTVCDSVIVTAWKPAEDGNGWILRYYNPDKETVKVTVQFDADVTVCRCNLLEKKLEEAFCCKEFAGELRGFGIETLRIVKK